MNSKNRASLSKTIRYCSRPYIIIIQLTLYCQLIFLNQIIDSLVLYSIASPVFEPTINLIQPQSPSKLTQNYSSVSNLNANAHQSTQIASNNHLPYSQFQRLPIDVKESPPTTSSPASSINLLNQPRVPNIDNIPGSAKHLGHTSHNLDAVNASSVQNDSDPDIISEGSGNGPIQRPRQKAKFDDTEEGDDDEDDDYDYLDSGSGHGKDLPASNKKQEVHVQSNQIKGPSLIEDNAYNPFRQPSNLQNVVSNNQQGTISSTTSSSSAPNIFASKTTPDIGAQESPPSRLFSSLRQPISDSRSNSTTINPVTQRDSMYQQASNPMTTTQVTPERPKHIIQNVTSTVNPTNLLNSTSQNKWNLDDLYRLNGTIHNRDVERSNNSSLMEVTTPKTTDVDYEYEEENEDEDSEDVSNFEDNESNDTETTISKTTTANSTVTPLMAPRPYQTSPKQISKDVPFSTTIAPKLFDSPPKTTMQPISDPLLPRLTSSTVKPIDTLSTANRQSEVSSQDEEENDDDDEEEEEEEIVDEELEDDLKNEDSGSYHDSSNTFHSNQYQNPTNSLSSIPLYTTTTSMPPIVAHRDDGQYKASKNVVQQPKNDINPVVTRPIEYQSTSRPLPIDVPSKKSPIYTPTTLMPSTLATQRATTIVFKATPTTAQPLLITIASILPSTTTVRPPSIRYATTSRSRVTPAVTETSVYDKSLHESEAGLTMQIYDKAVEVYRATNRAVHGAVEAVWPTNFELSSSTFEPLLSQPLLFMLALGAAVIGLVLIMMLLVYIITYQIQPKDDISLY